MITREKIARINELAAKSKTSDGLTRSEVEEQKKLRSEYLKAVKENLRAQLENIEIVDDPMPGQKPS